jgi:LuxR family transcriptional regulator, maltose regulon positive regulatory protein
MPNVLLATKLYPPPARAGLVSRARLVLRLDQTLRPGCRMALLCAPAGFGKTTALADWLASRTEGRGLSAEQGLLRHHTLALGPRVAWLSLDAADNDPIRFWRYVIAAFDTAQPGVEELVSPSLAAPQPIEAILSQLINAISARSTDSLVLVLEDYHAIEMPAIHDGVAFLLSHLPSHARLVVTSRADPPLPLARWRARGELAELRAADLRFTPEEAATFLGEVMGVPLAAAEVAALEAHTEGWIAGLQLAALAMRDRADRAGFVAAFTGSNRFVLDYLAEEVIARQPPHLQTFLLQSSILDRMCGPLCDALLGLEARDLRPGEHERQVSSLKPQASQAYSQLILDQLERANLFLVPLDERRLWYRYHHLFAEVLRERLRAGANPADVALLHRRASAWYEQHDLLAEAIQHALAAADFGHAASLIGRQATLLVNSGQSHTVLAWLNALPDQLLRSRPALGFVHAVILINTDRLEAGAARLDAVEQGLPAIASETQRQLIGAQVVLARANLARLAGGLARAVAAAGQVLEQAPTLPPELRAAALYHLACAYQLTGDVTGGAEQRIAEVAAFARASGNVGVHVAALVALGRLQLLQARMRQAELTYAQMQQVIAPRGDLLHVFGSVACFFFYGELLRQLNRLEEAERYLRQGLDLVGGPVTIDADAILFGATAMARLRAARGDDVGALAALEDFEQLARRRGFASVLLAQAAAMRAQLGLMSGGRAAALAWATSADLHADDAVSFPREPEYLALARVLIAQGRAGPALQLLARLRQAAEFGGRIQSTIEILVVQALALRAQGDTPAARGALEGALALAQPGGYIRIFVDEGAPLNELLTQIARSASPVATYAATLLAAFSGSALRVPSGLMSYEVLNVETQISNLKSQNSLVEPLSEREREILHQIAAGHSNQQIADALVIALSTVKKHINNIYGKLGVSSRTQALLRARELGLM